MQQCSLRKSNNQNEINTVANIFETYKNTAADNSKFDAVINFFSLNTDDDIKKDDTKAKDGKETLTDENKDETIRDIQQTIISQYKSLMAEINTNLSLDEFIAGSLNTDEFINNIDTDISPQEAKELISDFIAGTIEFVKSSDANMNPRADKSSDKKNSQTDEHFGENVLSAEAGEKLLDEYSFNQLNKIIAQYTDRDNLSIEEYGQIFALSQIDNNFKNMYSQYNDQLNSEGWVDDVYNVLKDITDLGITREMVQEDLDNYSGAMKSLKALINKDEDTAKETTDKEFARQVNNSSSFSEKRKRFKNITAMNKMQLMLSTNILIKIKTKLTSMRKECMTM